MLQAQTTMRDGLEEPVNKCASAKPVHLHEQALLFLHTGKVYTTPTGAEFFSKLTGTAYMYIKAVATPAK